MHSPVSIIEQGAVSSVAVAVAVAVAMVGATALLSLRVPPLVILAAGGVVGYLTTR